MYTPPLKSDRRHAWIVHEPRRSHSTSIMFQLPSGSWGELLLISRYLYSGFSFGIGITYPLCGFIIAHFGWRAVFYTTGTIGTVWCLFWYFFAFDTPAAHPRISQQELRYIQGSVVNQVHASEVSGCFRHYDIRVFVLLRKITLLVKNLLLLFLPDLRLVFLILKNWAFSNCNAYIFQNSLS